LVAKFNVEKGVLIMIKLGKVSKETRAEKLFGPPELTGCPDFPN
jgi:hypothetical protein